MLLEKCHISIVILGLFCDAETGSILLPMLSFWHVFEVSSIGYFTL